MKLETIGLAALLWILVALAAQAADLALIPWPAKVEQSGGQFALDDQTAIAADRAFLNEAAYLADKLRATTGLPLRQVAPARASSNVVSLIQSNADELISGGYELDATEQRVVILARDAAGAFYGCQTLLQLLPPEVYGSKQATGVAWRVPSVSIKDMPRFVWRGLLMDCSRTFQSVEYLRQTIDRLALYKMNVLHLHLTDDQGWRLEIKKHPALAEKGARFPVKYDEPASTQGFYRQEQIRELAAYAARRHVTIVPEIEMPGHALAALSVYPHLSCTGGPFEIFPFFKGPGITSDIFCAGREETFVFLKDVLDEVSEVFPSTFVHIGGDEAPRTRWRACPRCQKRLRDEGLRNEAELQSYLNRRVERMLAEKGRRLIGWDEILEGGLTPSAAVMSWRGMKGGIAAAQAGHDVVMSPTTHCYFDYGYDRINTRKVFEFEPVPALLSPEEARHVLGVQANFWSHIHRSPEQTDRQIHPRLLALAHRAWSKADCRDWEGFRRRLAAHRVRLRALNIAFNSDDMP